jgi:predicted ATP-dependent endonuclease of OLD family
VLNSLKITNFRTFRNLCLNRLGKVNLIVGRNNVGKTSLLEAVHLYSSDNVLYAVVRLLERRQEYSLKNGGRLLFSNLFYRDAEAPAQIEIGETTGENQLIIRPMWRWTEEIEREERIWTRTQLSNEPPENIELEATEVLAAKRGTETPKSISMESDRYPSSLRKKDRNFKSSLFLPSSGFNDEYIDPAELWDRIVLTDREYAVLDALKIIEPDLERIVMVQGQRSQRVAMAKLLQQKNMPLRSLGDGMNKLFELALGLVNEGRAFLVDEIDSGLHFTTLVDVWRLVFRTAEKLKVQVFATTHSWDCIEAFQKAAIEHPDDGLLIRLERSEADVTAELFSEEDLTIITRESIEVR